MIYGKSLGVCLLGLAAGLPSVARADEPKTADPAPTKASEARLKGMKDAVSDLEKGLIKRKDYNDRPDTQSQLEFGRRMRKDYGVVWETVERKHVSAEEIDGYNDVMRAEFGHRFGRGLNEKLEDMYFAAPETVENPDYQAWAGWRPGATATTKIEYDIKGTKGAGVQTFALKTVRADELTVRGSYGLGPDLPKGALADSVDVPVPARVPLPDEPKVKETRGKEPLTINGAALACEWVEREVDGSVVAKWWTCKDVPGGEVKRTYQTGEKIVSITTLVEWKGERK
jgi:hypothetical protein